MTTPAIPQLQDGRYLVPSDASIADTVADVTGGDPLDIGWRGDGGFSGDHYVFTGDIYGDTVTVYIDNKGDASFTIT